MSVGMLVSRRRVAAVIVRGHEVAWEATAVPDGDDVAAAVTGVLERLPRQAWWGRVRVRVAIDDPLSAVKTVRGLPPVRNTRSLARVLATAPARFFVLPGRTAVVTGIRVIAPGVVRAAAFDAQLVDAIRSGAGTAKVTVTSIVPASVAVGTLVGREREHPFAAAIGATRLSPREPIAVRTPRRRSRNARVGVTRITIAGVAAALSAVSAVSAVVLPAHADAGTATFAHGSRVQTARVTRVSSIGLSGADALGALTHVATFGRERTSMTLLLGALAAVLPERAAIASFRADGGGVTISAQAPRAGDIVRALERIPRISGIEISGPVTRDAGESERATLHFRTTPDPPEERVAFVPSTPPRTAVAANPVESIERLYRAFRSVLVTGHSRAEAATFLSAVVSDMADRTGVRIGILQLGSDSIGPGHLFRLTVRGDATGDVGTLTHFVAGLESGNVLLAVRELALTPNAHGLAIDDPGTMRADFALEALAMTDPPSTRP